MVSPRLPSTQVLLAFETVARLRSVNLAAEELNVTPSAVSHRIRQLETQLALRLFASNDFSLSADGMTYLARVREAIGALQQVPGRHFTPLAPRLRVAVPPTFSREILLPRLALFCHTYPDIEVTLQVATPVRNLMAEDADIELRFGTGPFADRESLNVMADNVSPVCSPDYLDRNGPFDGFTTDADVTRAQLIRSPLEPWRTWFKEHRIALAEPSMGNQFNDLGLVLDAAAAGLGVALMRLKLGGAWLESGRLIRLCEASVPSPNAYFLCWRPGALERWECSAFIDWLRHSLQD
jgi:LysR family transcriptional regulator, glycine cleavage system transcriptional activator